MLLTEKLKKRTTLNGHVCILSYFFKIRQTSVLFPKTDSTMRLGQLGGPRCQTGRSACELNTV